MIKDKEFNNAYLNIVGIEINFQKENIRVRSQVCDKKGNFIGIKREQRFDEKMFIKLSRLEAEKKVDISKLNKEALKKIKLIENENSSTLSKSEKDNIKNSFKQNAISKEAEKIGKNKLIATMKRLSDLKSLSEELLTF